jgi:hypothetical protein
MAGRCLITLASNQAGPYPIAIHGTNVYWANQGYMIPSTIMKVPLAGGTPTTLASYPDYSTYGADGIAVGEGSVYWTFGDTLMQVPIGGGPSTAFWTTMGGVGRVAVDATSVYWAALARESTLMKMPLSGGPAVTLASETLSIMRDIAVNATSVYWASTYNTMQQPGTITKVPLDGGASTTVESLAPWGMPMAVALDATSVYWTMDDGRILKAPLAGGAPTTIASGVNAWYIVVDETSVYWADNQDNTVMKVSRDGGTPTALFLGDKPWDIAVDATSVYWTSPSGGTVMRLSPK